MAIIYFTYKTLHTIYSIQCDSSFLLQKRKTHITSILVNAENLNTNLFCSVDRNIWHWCKVLVSQVVSENLQKASWLLYRTILICMSQNQNQTNYLPIKLLKGNLKL